MDLDGKVILITGAAGNLGAAAARRAAARGARLALLDRAEERVREALQRTPLPGAVPLVTAADLGDDASAAAAVQRVGQVMGRIDGVFHTVGAFQGGKPADVELSAVWDLLFEVNLRGALSLARAVVPVLRAQGGGRIVHVVSRHAFAGAGHYAAYSAAKAALLRASESMADELKPAGIAVNCIVPGLMDTPQNRAAMPGTPPAKFVAPEAVADAALFLLSDAARAITGAALPVYGMG